MTFKKVNDFKQKSVCTSFASCNVGAEDYTFDKGTKSNTVRLFKLRAQHTFFDIIQKVKGKSVECSFKGKERRETMTALQGHCC